jgi:lipopolysaccharide/colanic/teichoic acid biosynthesis glycosyltransferase/glycosyltransferase involved in cell wall biosynthesis
MPALKVLHLGKYYPPDRGGIETVVEAACTGAGAAIAPRALVLNKSARTAHETVDGIPVTRVASVGTVGAVSLTPTLAWWLRRADADVVVVHEPNPMALVACVLARPRVPVVVWFHSEVIRAKWKYRLFYEPMLDWVLRRAARIVVAAPPMCDVPALARYRDKVLVVPYGLDPRAYPVAPHERSPDAAAATAAEASPTLLFVGRLVAYKGVDVLLRAMTGVTARLVVVGDGPLRAPLEALARELGVSQSVCFAGHVTDAERLTWYRRADVVVLPSISRQEAFGMVQVEAMLSGRPVVSTALPTGVPWVNRHGETGLVVPPGDVDALRGALARLCTDAPLRSALGAGGRDRAVREFTAARMCAAIDELCGRVHAEQPADPVSRAGVLWPKRMLDVALSGAGLVVSAPLWALIALCIKLEDGGPIFYGQERSGLNGRPFRVRKFRSMIPDAEARTGAIQATRHDPRVTRVGRLLRATAMDELPQLWNIFRGDMSFTGPRALRPGEIEVLGGDRVELLEDVPGFARRASVRPGLTGVAQIYAARDITRRHKFRYDLLYVRRQSLWLDVRLIALSFWITFRGTWEVRGKKF